MAEAKATMSTDISIRPLTPADAPDFRALRLEALRDYPSCFGASHAEESASTVDDVAAMIASAAPGAIFGAFAAGVLVGIAGVAIGRRMKMRHKGLLWGVFVRPSHHRRGVGEALLRRAIDHARRQVVVLHATVAVPNSTARRLYDRLGFTEYGLEQKALCIDGAYIDETLLTLDLAG
jgi:GNAT superfamily N-acetyltransferase